jgi:hypothetical protein
MIRAAENYPARSYVSTCYDDADESVPSTPSYLTFSSFETINIYKNGLLYMRIREKFKNLFSVFQLFSGLITGYEYTNAGATYDSISKDWFNKGVSVFSTNKCDLFRFRFTTDYSAKLAVVGNTDGATTSQCILTFAEPVFKEALC